jgi:hypothetical protein
LILHSAYVSLGHLTSAQGFVWVILLEWEDFFGSAQPAGEEARACSTIKERRHLLIYSIAPNSSFPGLQFESLAFAFLFFFSVSSPLFARRHISIPGDNLQILSKWVLQAKAGRDWGEQPTFHDTLVNFGSSIS